MEALHGGSSKILFILQLFFKISLEVKIRQAILLNKHGAQHMFCVEEFKHSSSCIPKCNSLYLIFWDGVMSFLTISFMFHDSQVVRNKIIKSIIFSSFKRSFRPINLFVGVVLGYISPIAFPKECSYLWCLSMIQVFSYPLGEEVFISLLIPIQSIIVSVSGSLSPHNVWMFP